MLPDYDKNLNKYIGYNGPVDYERVDLAQARAVVLAVDQDDPDDLGATVNELADSLGIRSEAAQNLVGSSMMRLYLVCHAVGALLNEYITE